MPNTETIGKSFELISAGVDYATFTVSTGPRAVLLYDKGRALVEAEHDAGNRQKPWSSFGYLGWTSSHVTVGRRLDGAIIRLSGWLAHQYWRTFHGVSDKCTRLDIAVTGRCDVASFNVAHLAQREARAWRRKHDSRITVGFQFQEPGGATCTLGSRSSEKYARIYDKYAEAGAPYQPGTWRWEVEYKGEAARTLAETAYAENYRSEALGSLTMAFFQERGLSVPFAPIGGQWRYQRFTEHLTAERRLDFLRQQMAPMCRELAYQVGEAAVLDALGLAFHNR